MEQNKRNQRASSHENENWDQNQGRQGRDNDQNPRHNYQRNFNDENYGRNEFRQNRDSNYRYNNENDNDRNFSGNQFNQGSQNSGRRSDDGYDNNLRNRQNEDHNRNQDYRSYENEGNFSDRNFQNRDDGQPNSGSFNRNRYQGENFNRQSNDWINRTRDNVSSWFEDDDAEQRRHPIKSAGGQHKGKGPKDYKRSQERIREDVSDRLSDDSYVDATEIEIKVNGTDVILSGSVDSKEAKRRAEDITESVSGVSNVQNQLRVERPSTSSSPEGKNQAGSNQLKQEKAHHH